MAYLDLNTGTPGSALDRAQRQATLQPVEKPTRAWLPLAGSIGLIALVGLTILSVFRLLWRELDSPGVALLVTILLLLPTASLFAPRR